MPARDDQHHGGQRQLAVLERERFDVAGEVMDGDDGNRSRIRERFRKRHPDEQRSDQAGALRHRHGAEVLDRQLRIRERPLKDTADVAHVLPRRELGDDSPPLAVDRRLRGDDIGSDAPGAGRASGSGSCTPGGQVPARTVP